MPLDVVAYKVVDDLKLYGQFYSLQKIIQQAYHREFLLFCALTTGLLRLRIY
jgi:hypothetical protein